MHGPAGWPNLVIHKFEGDVLDAVRLAIVMAAAEIGKGMRVIPEISEERKHMHEAMCSSPYGSLESLVEKYCVE